MCWKLQLYGMEVCIAVAIDGKAATAYMCNGGCILTTSLLHPYYQAWYVTVEGVHGI